MADRAQVTSTDAIETFRARLIVYLSKARPTLEEVSTEVHRTRIWLQIDQRRFWEEQLKARRKKLDQVQAELLAARISSLQTASSAQMMAVRKARDAVREAEGKVAALKRWDRELENRTEPFMRQLNQLQHSLTTDLPKAIAYLGQVLKSLEAYAETPASRTSAASSATGEGAATEPPASEPGPPTGEGERP